jgi:PIN domain nuclease of toxin-antitoxin system
MVQSPTGYAFEHTYSPDTQRRIGDQERETQQVGVSAISCYEIALAQQRGRLELPCAANQWVQDALKPYLQGFEVFMQQDHISYSSVSRLVSNLRGWIAT